MVEPRQVQSISQNGFVLSNWSNLNKKTQPKSVGDATSCLKPSFAPFLPKKTCLCLRGFAFAGAWKTHDPSETKISWESTVYPPPYATTFPPPRNKAWIMDFLVGKNPWLRPYFLLGGEGVYPSIAMKICFMSLFQPPNPQDFPPTTQVKLDKLKTRGTFKVPSGKLT